MILLQVRADCNLQLRKLLKSGSEANKNLMGCLKRVNVECEKAAQLLRRFEKIKKGETDVGQEM